MNVCEEPTGVVGLCANQSVDTISYDATGEDVVSSARGSKTSPKGRNKAECFQPLCRKARDPIRFRNNNFIERPYMPKCAEMDNTIADATERNRLRTINADRF